MANNFHLKDLSSNFEDYLKAIGDLQKKKGQVRSKDIAKIMNVKPSSVTNALQILRDQKLITYEPYETIIMTPRGKRIWLIIHQKYKTVRSFLTDILEVDGETAHRLACIIEHQVTSQVTERILLLRQFLNGDTNCGPGTIDRLHEFFLRFQEKADKNIEKEIPMFMLSSLQPGEKGTVYKLKGDPEIRRKFMDMGLNRGQEIIVERVAPMGDPLEVTIRGYQLSLRKEEADLIIVT